MSTYAKYADKYKNRLRTRSSQLPTRSSFPSSLTGPNGNLLIQQSPLNNISQTINNLSYRQNNSSLSPAATTATRTFIANQTTPPRKVPPIPYQNKPLENKISSSTSLMVDRNAYMSYLEVQLDKVSSACLTVQGFAERVEQLQSQINTHEDKIINMARLVKLQQSYSNGQEEQMRMIQEDIANVLTTKNLNTEKISNPNEGNSSKLRRSYNNQKSVSVLNRSSNQRGRSNSQGRTQSNQIRRPLKPVVPMGKQDAIQAQNILWREEIERNLNQAVIMQGRDMSRDVTGLEERMKFFQKEIEFVKSSMKKNQFQNSQQNVLGNSQNQFRFSLSRGKNNNGKKENQKSQEYVQKMLHQWGATIENQVNEITDKINNSRRDNLTLNKKVNDIIEKRDEEIAELRQIAQGAEQLCNRLADDSLKKSNAIESKLNVMQGRILKKIKNHRKSSFSNIQESDDDGPKQRKTSQGSRTSKSPSGKGVTLPRVREEIRLCQEVLTQKITNAVEKLGGLLKKYVKDQKRLTSRVDHIDNTTAANTTSTSFAKKTISSNLKATQKNNLIDKNRKIINQENMRSNRSVKQASVNSSMQFKPMNRQKLPQKVVAKPRQPSQSQTNNFSSEQNNNRYYTDDQKLNPDALDMHEESKVPYYPDMQLFSDPYEAEQRGQISRSRSPTLGEVKQDEEQFQDSEDSSLDGIVKGNNIKKRESIDQSNKKKTIQNSRELSEEKFNRNRDQFSALSPQSFNLRHKFRQNSSQRRKTPEQDRNTLKKRRKNSNISDISNKSAKRDQKSKKKIMKAIGRDLEKKTRYERTGEVRRTMAKSKSTSNTRRSQKLYGLDPNGFTSQSYQDISPDASPMRRNKFLKVRPQSAKNAYESRLKFRFSPYQTERSKVRELAARIKKEKSVREKLMDDIVGFQKEMKGKNRHSAVNLEIDQDDTPKFKDAYKDYLGGDNVNNSNKGKISSSKKDQVMEKLNKKLKLLQQPSTKCEKQKFR